MKSNDSTVLVLFNAPEGNAEPSVCGVLDQVNAVSAALDAGGFTHRIAGVSDLQSAARAVSDGEESVVFNLVEDLSGDEEAACLVPGLCQGLGRGVTGSPTACLGLTLDKVKTRAVLRDQGIPVPDGTSVRPDDLIKWGSFPKPGPFIVKPAIGDASEGIDGKRSVFADTGPAMAARIRALHEQFGKPVLIERFIGHREINVSLMRDRKRLRVLPVAEIDFSAFPADLPRVVDYAAKWLPDSFSFRHTPRIIPARLPQRIVRRAEELAVNAWNVAGCGDYARVDMRLDDEGRLFVLEINANPDLSPDSGFQAACVAGGLLFSEFVRTMVENAQKRRVAPVKVRTPSEKESPKPSPVEFRALRRRDREEVSTLLASTGFFRKDELVIAREVLDAEIEKGARAGYISLVAETKGRIVGWVSFGEAACALGTWEIYWLATEPEFQGRGIGTALLEAAEEKIRQAGARLIVVETSTRTLYQSTRTFYEKMGYGQAGTLRDFYAPGDSKLFYVKRIGSAQPVSAHPPAAEAVSEAKAEMPA